MIILAGLALSSCSPSLGSRIKIPDVEISQSKLSEFSARSPRIKIGDFLDARSQPALAVIDGRDVMPEGDMSDAVKLAFERAFTDAGARVTTLHAPVIEGEISTWIVRIKPGFPVTDLTAKASIRIVLRNDRDEPIYKATYTGESNKQHPVPGEESIRDTLGNAMAVAVAEVLNDQDFRVKLQG